MLRDREGRLLRLAFFSAAAVVIVLYAFSRTVNFLRGPSLTIEKPADNEYILGTDATIEGRASRVSALSLNGREIFTDEKGIFRERLPLLSGYNIITVRATDKFGRIVAKTIHLVTP